MPTRSLSSSVLKWPNHETVINALKVWTQKTLQGRHDVKRIGFFGSYARGDWGVGSDLDIVAVIEKAADPFERRAAKWDLSSLPVPADLLVYTQAEWENLDRETRFMKTMESETIWLHP
jgi:predicted nucleotidyltransferase